MSTAMNFQVNLFPIHSNQRDQSLRQTLRAVSVSMTLIQSIYTTISVCGLFAFGKTVSDSLLANIGAARAPKTGTLPWESYLMQALFLVVLACHVPYLYFSGKEAMLIIVDEVLRRSTSFAIGRKVVRGDDVGRESSGGGEG